MKDAAAEEQPKEEPKEETKEEAKEETKEPEPEAPKEPEKPKEQEQDAQEDSRAKVAGTVGFSTADSTLNVMQIRNGKFLMSLTEGGLQFLLAGARSTVGVKSGRYMLEVKIVESHKQAQQQGKDDGRAPVPRQLVRFGLSKAGSSTLLADGT